VISVFCNSSYSLAITNTGEVFAWGANTRQRLGSSLPDKIEIPAKIPDLKNISQLSGSLWHVIALTSDGVALSAGSNKHGELGHPSEASFA